jgi:hypothetical protein
MIIKLYLVRLLLFITFPIAFACFTLSGAFEALYEHLTESEAHYESELESPSEGSANLPGDP